MNDCSLSNMQTPRHQGNGNIPFGFEVVCSLSRLESPRPFIFLDFLQFLGLRSNACPRALPHKKGVAITQQRLLGFKFITCHSFDSFSWRILSLSFSASGASGANLR